MTSPYLDRRVRSRAELDAIYRAFSHAAKTGKETAVHYEGGNFFVLHSAIPEVLAQLDIVGWSDPTGSFFRYTPKWGLYRGERQG